MGRRSINTTKSGKYMNPTDQARKEARKKELKKNKRQRQMVRTAVLKMKDPSQILEELQKIDEMEFNVLQPSPLNEKVLKEKRKKLKETFERVLKMYDKDEPDKWVELKRQEGEYEKTRNQLISYYESVKHSQSMEVDDIPLPTLQLPDNMMPGGMNVNIPLPVDQPAVLPKPILKKDTVYKERPPVLVPPGVPPGPPPDLLELITQFVRPNKKLRFAPENIAPPGETIPEPTSVPEEEPSQPDQEQHKDKNKPAPKPTSLQQRMLALSGQNIDEFMKEMEEVHKKRERDRAADLNARLSALKEKEGVQSDSDSEDEPPRPVVMDTSIGPLLPPGTAPSAAPGPPPLAHPLMPHPHGFPPPPPPLRMAMFLSRPPGPPPGAPRAFPLPPRPSLVHPPLKNQDGATISAKPQIRNLSADVTRFVPSALRVKREDKTKSGAKGSMPKHTELPKQGITKDDAYMQFMKEMEGLL